MRYGNTVTVYVYKLPYRWAGDPQEKLPVGAVQRNETAQLCHLLLAPPVGVRKVQPGDLWSGNGEPLEVSSTYYAVFLNLSLEY